MRLTAQQMARLADSMEKATEEIDAVLAPDVSVTQAAASTALVDHLHSLQRTLSHVRHLSA